MWKVDKTSVAYINWHVKHHFTFIINKIGFCMAIRAKFSLHYGLILAIDLPKNMR